MRGGKEWAMIINPEDFKVDLIPNNLGGSSSGKIPTGIRVTHIPTGEYIEWETERSQLANKNIAMKRLIERLKRSR